MNTQKKRITKVACLLIALIMAASVTTGCAKKNTVAATSSETVSAMADDLTSSSSADSSNIPQVKLDSSAATVKIGEKVTLKVSTIPESDMNKVTWTSSDAKIATVDKGVVTGVAAGTAQITAAVNDEKTNCTITVSATAATSKNGVAVSSVASKASSSAPAKPTATTPASKAHTAATKPSTGTKPSTTTTPRSTARATASPSTRTSTQRSTTTTTRPSTPASTTLNMPSSSQLATINQYLVGMVNSIRGSSVSERSGLMQAANIRANECLTKYSHTRPNGTDFSTVFTQVQYGTYTEQKESDDGVHWYVNKYYSVGTCGEILGGTARTSFSGSSSELREVATSIFNAWRNSSGHYAIMVGSSYHNVGFGTVASWDSYNGRKAIEFTSIGDFTQK